ncbi:hypothetical protein [Bizionia sp.]|uniref:hypothetical protein n=1 Tax=Bizionia sp. TaxID=1954480 RepID=UPI003A8F33B5
MKHTLLILLSVFTFGTTVFAQNSSAKQDIKKVADSMIFLTYHIKKSTDATPTISHLKAVLAKGRIKGFHKKKELMKTGNLTCNLLDKELKVIETLYIENPLEKVVEFVNDSGDLEKRLIALESTDFAFRMPYHETAKYARMYVITNSDTTNYIITKL